MNPAWAVHLEHIRRRWALVVLLALVSGAAAAGALLLAPASWTGRAALAIVSQSRSPDQDAVLGRGYVDLFNQESLQAEYRRRDGLGDDVAFSARLAAGTPILYVEAVASDPVVAGHAATALAVTLRDDVRNNITGDRVQAATDLTTQIGVVQRRLVTLTPTSPDRQPLTDQLAALQAQLAAVQANTTNQLRDLQLDAGVTENVLPLPRTVVLAVLGGAVLGALAAVGIGAAGPGLRSPTQVRARLGLGVLAHVSVSEPDEETDRELARVLAHPDLPRPGRLAVVSSGRGEDAARSGPARARVGGLLAHLAVKQGITGLLVRADVAEDARADPYDERPGVSEALARPGTPSPEGLVRRDLHGVLVIGPGARRADPYTVFSRHRTTSLIDRAAEHAELVVVDAPATVEHDDAGAVVAAAAGTAVLVLTGRTRVADARDALEAITRSGGAVLGVVTVETGSVDGPPTARPDGGEPDGTGRSGRLVAEPPRARAGRATPWREPTHALSYLRSSPGIRAP